MTFAQILKLTRQRMNLTQKELGERTGIGETTIGKYENGKLNPKIETIQKLAAGLGVDPYHFQIMKESTADYNRLPQFEAFLYGEFFSPLMTHFVRLDAAGQRTAVALVKALADTQPGHKETPPQGGEKEG